MYAFLSIITPKTKTQSGPAVYQPFPSGKIFGVWTDITVMLELLLVRRTPDSVFHHILWDPLGWTIQEIGKRREANWNLGVIGDHMPPPPRKKSSNGPLAAVRTRWINHEGFLLLVNSKQATLIYWGRYTNKQMSGFVRFFLNVNVSTTSVQPPGFRWAATETLVTCSGHFCRML